jgi:DNA-binding NarL/FixJ family response regulator
MGDIGRADVTGRVLIVDDDPIVREAVRAVLESVGHEIVGEGGNGVEALELTGRLRPQVVLIDQRMPVMDGLDATAAICERYAEVDVIVMSAHEDPESIRRSIAAGASEHVVKGTGAGALRAAVERTLASTQR